MNIDMHTHGKLAKKLPFSTGYTDWLFAEAQNSGLDGLCLTEHFNTLGFDEIYEYIQTHYEPEGDTFRIENLRIFPGMEIDIAEGGHILCIGTIGEIREFNRRLEPYKQRENFLPFEKLMDMAREYQVLMGAGHPFRKGGNIPKLPADQLKRLDFVDLNGKDVASDRAGTQKKVTDWAEMLSLPVTAGSDTHQSFQYGCIYNRFRQECVTVRELRKQMKDGQYDIFISPEAALKVRSAEILKRALKEIHALGGDYVSVLTGQKIRD